MADVAAVVTAVTSAHAAIPSTEPSPILNIGVWVTILATSFFFVSRILIASFEVYEKFRNRNKALVEDEKERNAPIENRLKRLEDAASNFRSTQELDKESSRLDALILHNKRNSDQCFDQLNNMHRNISSEVIDIARRLTKAETKVEGMENNISRVERAVEKLTDRVEERFDGLLSVITDSKKS